MHTREAMKYYILCDLAFKGLIIKIPKWLRYLFFIFSLANGTLF
jgi:hypothetical protein